MIQQRNNVFWFKLNGLLRQFIVRGGCRWVNRHYTINEYPKSGGTWLGQMMAEALDLPFPKNRLPKFSSCIMHGHYLHPWNMKDTAILWRDGRDIVVSQYYHSLFFNDKGNRRLVDITRKKFRVDDYEDIHTNLPAFIELVYKEKVSPRFSWSDFVHVWADADVVHTKYEDLRADTAQELMRVVRELSGRELSKERALQIADKYSFEKQSGRKPGEENSSSFMRKGIVGDWKNKFSKEAREVFDHYAGDALIKLGYENDRSWTVQG